MSLDSDPINNLLSNRISLTIKTTIKNEKIY